MNTKSILLISLVIMLVGCRKKQPDLEPAVVIKPTASFYPDIPYPYNAGDTIHLISKVTNAVSYKWITPDSVLTTPNISYAIDSNDIGGYKIFRLQVTSKYGTVSDEYYHSIDVKEGILNSDFYDIGTGYHKPFTKKYSYYSNSTTINDYYYTTNHENTYSFTINIYRYNGVVTSGIYAVQPNVSANGTASIGFSARIGFNGPTNKLTSYSGSLNVLYTNKGKMRVQFNHVRALWNYSNPYDTINISGDITCH